MVSLLFPFTVNALSATTANVIHGTAPYIELNDIKAVDLSSLLSIDVGGVKYVSDSSGNMKKVESNGTLTPVTSITLANAGDKFDSVKTLVPADGTDYDLNSTLPPTSKKDDDGDAIISVSGNIKGVWKDKNGNSIGGLTGFASNCLSTYTLTLTTSNNPTISTQYGAPASSRQTAYGNSTAVFKINPATQPEICFAKPDMSNAVSRFAGPASMWDTAKGFKLQSTSPDSYNKNFPTTGSDGLYFDLDIGGSTKALTWDTVTAGDIKATMKNSSATKVTVTLTGPVASTTQKNANTPGSVTKPSLPATIELVGKDGSTEVVKYGFVIQQWFINRGNISAPGTGTPSQTSWCISTGYLIPRVKDLTSATGTAFGYGGTIPTVPYPNTNSGQYSGSNYWRHIRGGLFSEWGNMGNYTSGGWVYSSFYWTSDTTGSYQFFVHDEDGSVNSHIAAAGSYGVCRSN